MPVNRRFVATVLIPTLLVQAGTTMGNTFLPLYARGLGSTLGIAAVLTALMFIGQALADLPAGFLVHRFGERRMMLAGMLLAIVALILRIAVPSIEALVVSILLYGVGASFTWTSRMSWMKREIRGAGRGYSMSFVGGFLRLANIIGPLTGGFVAEHWGYRNLFSVQAILCAAAFITVFVSMPPGEIRSGTGSYRQSLDSAVEAWKDRKRTIFAATLGIGGLTILRTSREILFPLWGGELGMSESRIGVVVFIGALVDASLFWLSGIIMTRMGRKTAGILCTSLLALAIGLLPLADSMGVLVALSVLAGIGNATGAGINLTISGDLAPRAAPAAFLSAWRFVMGFAGFVGPALAAWMIRIAGTDMAPPVVGATGLFGALVMAAFMRETAASSGRKRD